MTVLKEYTEDVRFTGNVEILGEFENAGLQKTITTLGKTASTFQTYQANITEINAGELLTEYQIIYQRAVDAGVSGAPLTDYTAAFNALYESAGESAGAGLTALHIAYVEKREELIDAIQAAVAATIKTETLSLVPGFHGTFPYSAGAGVDTYYTGAVKGDYIVCTSSTEAELGIYQFNGSTWDRLASPTEEQIGACFLAIIDAVQAGYGDSSDYIPSSMALETILVKFLYVLKMRLETSGAIHSGGYNDSGANDGTPGAFISGLGDFKGRGAYFKDITSETLKTLIAYAGAWVYGSWGSEFTSVTASVDYIEISSFSDGRILCLYTDGTDVYETIRGTNGVWSTPVLLSEYKNVIAVLVLEDDSAIAVVNTASVDGLVVTRSISGSWSDTSDSLGYTFDGNLVLLDDYSVLYVYRNGTKIYERVRSTGGVWGSDTAVNTTDGYYSLDISKFPDGSVIMIYKLSNVLYEMVRSAAGVWGSPSSIYSPGDSITDFSILALPDSTALCSVAHGATFTTYLYTFTRNTSGTWAYEGQRTSAQTTTNALALLSDGKILLAYRRAAGGYIYSQINASAYSAIPVGSFQTDVGSGIVEVGENSHGIYIKFGDGTMICSRDGIAIGASPTDSVSCVPRYYLAISLSFPEPFVAGYAPAVSASLSQAPYHDSGVVCSSITNTGLTITGLCNRSGGFSGMAADYIAIGRWK